MAERIEEKMLGKTRVRIIYPDGWEEETALQHYAERMTKAMPGWEFFVVPKQERLKHSEQSLSS